MGKEMRELHKVHKLAIELIRSGRISWNDAIEKAKEEVRTNSKLDLDNGEITPLKLVKQLEKYKHKIIITITKGKTH